MDKNFEPLKHYIAGNDWENEITELHKSNINVSEKDGFYLYNYNQNVLVPRDDPIIKSCRGLVLDKNGFLKNLPFFRFFNAHESECDDIDWESAEILEKLDGSLISVWWTGIEWEVTTRGSFYPNEHAHNFKETFCRLFGSFDRLSPGNSYIFELISKDNRIVTKYDEERVVLIGKRDLRTLKECDQTILDEIAKVLRVSRPCRYKASNVDECRKLFEGMKDDEEGFVIVDKNFNRMKLKQESYLKMSKIISMKNQDVLDYMLGRTELDADFTDMPELKEKIVKVQIINNEVRNYCEKIYWNIKSIENQREFASHALNYKISALLFNLRKGVKYNDINIRYDRLIEYHDSIVSPKEKTLLILMGIPGSGKSTWIKENQLELYSLSMDSLRIMYETPNPGITQKYNGRVANIFNEMLDSRMKVGSFTVIDNVHASEKYVRAYEPICERYGYKMRIVYLNVSLKEAIERNSFREEYKRVPEEVIEKMYNQLNTNVYKA